MEAPERAAHVEGIVMSLSQAPLPVEKPKTPAEKPSPGACDAHLHMLAQSDDFPLWSGRAEDPGPGSLDDWLDRFRLHLDVLGIERGVIVHSIFYGTDNAVTVAALDKLGRDRFRAVGLVDDDATDADLDALVDAGIVGVRLNYVHRGVLSFEGVAAMAPRLAERGLHVQMLMNADKHMADLAGAVVDLGVSVVFDHIGWPDLAAGVDEPGFEMLRRLLDEGKCWIKLSGIYRLCGAPYEASDAAVAALVDANPERCLWGSDWPHIMLADAAMPDAGELLDALHRVVTDTETRQRILVDNPAGLYGFG